jgi:Tfp pilus assembly protein PilE
MTPRLAVGAGGGLAGMMGAVAIVGILAAIGIPNFLAFQIKSKLAQASDAIAAQRLIAGWQSDASH